MRLLGMNPTEKEVQAAMESVDNNGNGKLEQLVRHFLKLDGTGIMGLSQWCFFSKNCLRFDEFRSLMEPRLSAWLENDQVKILTDCFKVFDTEGLKLGGISSSTFHT